MYYSSGNYEAFARPKKPFGIENKHAYIVGSGIAGMATAVFLIRDAQMPGNQIHILEEMNLDGGSLDGSRNHLGFVMRGGREMESHYECLWDLFRSIPSLEIPGASVLDEFYWLNKEDPNTSNCRIIHERGKQAPDDGKFTISEKGTEEILNLLLTPERDLQNKRIDEVFTDAVFDSNFWIYWESMFAFERWQSAMEMRRYLARFIHAIGGMPDFSVLKFTRYDQYYSLVLPLTKYLKDHGVDIQNNVQVENIVYEKLPDGQRMATKILAKKSGQQTTITLTKNDFVFVTNGSATESTTYGDNNTVAKPNHEPGGSWQLWEKIAAQFPDFGRPSVFYQDLPEKSWFVSATITTSNPVILKRLGEISKRDPISSMGKTMTGGIVTAKDSNWLQSYTINRQPQFKDPTYPKGAISVWFYALLSGIPGNYIQKPVEECTGLEVASEWLYHIGIPEEQIAELAADCQIVTAYMPFICSYFMGRQDGDRPLVVPEGSLNFAFIGNFCEQPRDVVFTTEYSVRSAMVAVYELLNVDRGIPEVYGSVFDVRRLLGAAKAMMDGKTLTEQKLPMSVKMISGEVRKKIRNTVIEDLLKAFELI